jgi:hypothetical protein
VKRAAEVLGALFVLLGIFWAGRESDHGLAAFWEHWWCPIPLAVIVLGVVGVVAGQRTSTAG